MSIYTLLDWFRNERGVPRHRQPSKTAGNQRAKRPTGRKACLESLEPRVVLTAEVVISELVASNVYGLLDYDDDDSDWIEVHNRDSSSVDLQGWHLTDSARNLTKWQVPVSTVLAPDERLVVFASNKDFVAPNGELHTDFRLSSDGEFLALVDPEGALVHRVGAPFPPQATDVSYGLNENAPLADTFAFFATPTPGEPNAVPFEGFMSPPTFSIGSGTFTDEFTLDLTTSEPGAVIRTTFDGTFPDGSSTLYSGPFTVSTTTRIRARVFREGFVPSEVVSQSYIKLADDVLEFSSNLPIVVIENSELGGPIGRPWRNAFMGIFEPDGTGRSRLTNPADLTSRIGMHRRGGSTSTNPKVNLRIETRDELDRDREVELLGFPRESDYILYAPFTFDRALMRNAFIFELSRQIGRYASRTRFVEVYANLDDGELSQSDYLGLYVLEENIKADGNRVDVERLSTKYNSEPKLTGGYIFKVDRSPGAHAEFSTARRTYVLVEPDPDFVTPAQRSYISGFVDDLETALFSPNFADPELGYRAFFNVDPSIDHHILRYLTNIVDHFSLSTHMYKDRDGKVQYGPIWDHDRAMGADEGGGSNPIGFGPFLSTHWFNRLFQDPDFAQAWVDRWDQLRMTFFTDENFAAIIDGMAAEIAEAQARNFERWPLVAPNGGKFAEPGLTDWEAEVSHLKGWLTRRLEWTDSQLVRPASFSSESGTVAPGFEVTLSAPEGTVYYTLDGSDPRATGNDPAPQAIEYTGEPIIINQTTKVIARVLKQGGPRLPWKWSSASLADFTVLQSTDVPGDANRDGEFNFEDIEQVVAAGKFETGELATWEQGDWNKDGFFTFDDVLEALATGAYRDSSAELLAAMSGTVVRERPSSAAVGEGKQEGVVGPLPLPADAIEAEVIRAKKIVDVAPPSARPQVRRPFGGLRDERSGDRSLRAHDGDDVGERVQKSSSLPAEANRLQRTRKLPADAVFRQLGERIVGRRPASLLRRSARNHSSRSDVAEQAGSGALVGPVVPVHSANQIRRTKSCESRP